MDNLVICNYGESWNGKTTFLASVIEYALSINPLAKARLLTCENYVALAPYLRKGVLDIWRLSEREEPFDTCRQAVQGWFPTNTQDPKSKVVGPTKDYNGVNVWLIEGMATIADYMMGGYAKGGLASRSGRGERIGPAEETISFTDGDSKIGGNPRTHYNVVQREIHGLVEKSYRLPGIVIWTAHEVVAKDERTQKPILGPEIVGTAATGHCFRWFDAVLHSYRMDKRIVNPTTKEAEVESDYRVYLKSHYTSELPSIPYKCGLRVPTAMLEVANKLLPEYIPSNTKTFTEFMRLKKELDRQADELIELKKGA
jgi:hypothetical protein